MWNSEYYLRRSDIRVELLVFAGRIELHYFVYPAFDIQQNFKDYLSYFLEAKSNKNGRLGKASSRKSPPLARCHDLPPLLKWLTFVLVEMIYFAPLGAIYG